MGLTALAWSVTLPLARAVTEQVASLIQTCTECLLCARHHDRPEVPAKWRK